MLSIAKNPSISPIRFNRSTNGFTVVEVFMMILLVTSVLTLIVINFFSFEGALQSRPASIQFERAVYEGHRLARSQKQTIILSYDQESESVLLANTEGRILETFTFPTGTSAEISFFKVLPETEIKSEPDFEVEEHAIKQLRFFPNGSSTPAIIEFTAGRESKSWRMDPFSGILWTVIDRF